jgi:hypothetical protein
MKFLRIVIVISYACIAHAQDFPRNEMDFSRITDELVSMQDDDIPYEELYENYLLLFSNPINLNRATADQLRQLNLLTESQIAKLCDHIVRHGKLLSVYELQAIDEFDISTCHKLMPFVIVTPEENELNAAFVSRLYKEHSSYFVARYERTAERFQGFRSSEDHTRFRGAPYKMYLRMRSVKSNDFSYGFTLEKDPGEQLQWAPEKKLFGFDYMSCHLQVMNKKRITNLILGDFQFQFGQGLLLGTAFGAGKGGETITTIRKPNPGFMPYTSVNESGGMRGVAATLRVRPGIFISPFYSNAKRDATLYYDNILSFSSLTAGGLHRNLVELAKRRNLGERMYGAVLNFKTATLDGGVIFQTLEYDHPMIRFPNAYNQFAFRGDRSSNAGIFINYIWKNINLFGEAAKSLNGGSGIVAGSLISFSRELDMAVLYRKYDENFYTFYGNALGENSTSQNETGFYFGLKYRFDRRFTLAGYADLFSFPWLKFRVYSPTRGNECLLRLNFQPSRKTTAFFQYRREAKPRNSGLESTVYSLENTIKHNATINFDHQLSLRLKLKTRAQFSMVDVEGRRSRGMVILNDLVWSAGKFEFAGRHALFDTDNFDNRQYVYERDVWLAYSLPAYDGWGLRNFAIIEYKFNRGVSISAKYSRTYYKDRQEIGSGLQMIRGNTRNDVKLQLVMRF